MLSLFLLAPLLTAPPQNHTEMGKLRPGVVETHTIAPGDMHLWTIDAAPGGRVHGRLLQLQGDAVLVVSNPQGQELPAFDFSQAGREPFRFRSTQDGPYFLAIFAAEEAETPIRYQLYLGFSEPLAEGLAARLEQFLRTASPAEPAVVAWLVEEGAPTQAFVRGRSLSDPSQALRPDEALPMGEFELALAQLAVLQLIESKQIQRGDALRDVAALPNLDARVTVDHLLHRDAGLHELNYLARLRDYVRYAPTLSPAHFEEYLEAQRDATRLGKQTTSVRMTLGLLQRVCESVTGETYSDWVREELFRPWGMTDSFVLPVGEQGSVVWTRSSWNDGQWSGRNPLDEDRFAVPMISVRDLSTWLDLIRSDESIAVAWRALDQPAREYDNSGTVDLSRLEAPDDPTRWVIYLDLGSLEGGLDTTYIRELLKGQPLPLTHPGREMGFGGRGGRYGGRAARQHPDAPIALQVAGSYTSSEAMLTVELMQTEAGFVQLVHPKREKPVEFFQDEGHLEAVSKWILMRSIRFEVDEQGKVTGFRASGDGITNLLFERQVSDE